MAQQHTRHFLFDFSPLSFSLAKADVIFYHRTENGRRWRICMSYGCAARRDWWSAGFALSFTSFLKFSWQRQRRSSPPIPSTTLLLMVLCKLLLFGPAAQDVDVRPCNGDVLWSASWAIRSPIGFGIWKMSPPVPIPSTQHHRTLARDIEHLTLLRQQCQRGRKNKRHSRQPPPLARISVWIW